MNLDCPDCPYCNPDIVAYETDIRLTGQVEFWLYEHTVGESKEYVVVELKGYEYDTVYKNGAIAKGGGKQLGDIVYRTLDQKILLSLYPKVPRIRAKTFQEQMRRRLVNEA